MKVSITSDAADAWYWREARGRGPRAFRRFAPAALLLLFVAAPSNLHAAIIGTNGAAEPLTLQRIGQLPPVQQAPWKAYFDRSKRQLEADKSALAAELRAQELKDLLVPPEGRNRRMLPLTRNEEWFRDPEARRIGDIVLSFQTPAGGWSKNLDMTTNPRKPGMHFAPDNRSRFSGDGDFDVATDASWNYVGTFDNSATVMQLRFLAKLIAAGDPSEMEAYRAAFERGIRYIAAAQYPNGGWPQVWPLAGGYHDAITCNDNAFSNILGLLRDAASGADEFAFVPEPTRALARDCRRRGLVCLLAMQVEVDGVRTAWAQQYDMLTMKPTAARNYEMPSLAAGESAGILLSLMRINDPTPEIVRAVHDGAAWFNKTKIHDVAYRNNGEAGPQLMSAPGFGPIWSRYYEIGTDRSIFGDRDRTIRDSVNEVSRERRVGYAWYVNSGQDVLKEYVRWKASHPGLERKE